MIEASADDFHRLSKALKNAGRTGLRKELHKGVRDAVKPLLPEARKELAAGLPGPLRARGAKTRQVVQVKTGRNPGVTVAVRYGKRGAGLSASNARLLNRSGQVRHPVFGSRRVWANTPAPRSRGWFDDTYRRSAPTVTPVLVKAMERVADQIVREAR